MNVLIVDDEEEVLLGLKKVIPWEKIGYTICGEAVDGLDALNKIKFLNPELVLLDIKMPQCTGLEIIKKSRNMGFTGEFIILSGYPDFSYAQTAINLGVNNYLTKPVDEDELENAVIKVKKKIQKKNQIENRFNQYKKNARNTILVSLLTGDESPNSYDLHDLGMVADQYMVVLCEYYNDNSNFHFWKLKDILMNAYKTSENISVETIIVESTEYLLLIGSIMIQQFYRLIEHYQFGTQINSPLNAMFIIYGRPVLDIAALSLSFHDVKVLSQRKFYCQPSLHILSYQNLPEQNTKPLEISIQKEMASQITHAIFAHNRNMVVDYLQELENELMYCSASETEIKQAMIDIFFQIKQDLLCHDIKTASSLPSNKSIMDTINEKKYLYEIIQYISEKINVCMNSDFTDVIDNVLYYIDHNFSNSNIRLESLAPLFGYSSSYLGKMFSQKVGENFNTYLDHVRVEQAVKLLEKKECHVYEISEKVGYTDVNYFYKKFKKYTGLTPTEYRTKSKEL